jgi:hypothetical protein
VQVPAPVELGDVVVLADGSLAEVIAVIDLDASSRTTASEASRASQDGGALLALDLGHPRLKLALPSEKPV